MLSSHVAKNILLSPSGKSLLELPRLVPTREGRFANVTDVGHGMRWTLKRRRAIVIAGRGQTREQLTAHRRTMLSRTVKSCGPDASTLALSLRRRSFARPGRDAP